MRLAAGIVNSANRAKLDLTGEGIVAPKSALPEAQRAGEAPLMEAKACRGYELLGCSIAERRVRSIRVVVEAPSLDDVTGFGKRFERMFVEAFVSKLAVEAFDEGILRWLPRRNVV